MLKKIIVSLFALGLKLLVTRSEKRKMRIHVDPKGMNDLHMSQLALALR